MILEDPDPQTYKIIGAAMEVHRVLGSGFLEPVYQEALEIEFQCRDIPAVREAQLPIIYRDQHLNTSYRADFLCFDSIIIELKATTQLAPIAEAQVVNYLKAAHLNRGLLLNFGTPRLNYKRLILSPSHLR